MPYPSAPLAEVAWLYDSLHKTPVYSDNGYRMVRVTDIHRGFVDLDEAKYVDERTFEEFTKNYAPTCGDTLFTRVGSFGNSCYVNRSQRFCLGQNTVCIKPQIEKIDPFYLYCCLNSPQLQDQIVSFVGGASQPTISLQNIRLLSIPFPTLQTQQKIATLLSTYDNLIENNTRRIRTLEEMARAIYHEWFVNFHFPGHESVLKVESEFRLVPEGWEVKRLDEVAEVIDCLHGIKPTEVTNDNEKFGILLHVWNIGNEGKLNLSKKFFITEDVYRLWTKRIEVKEGDCVITNVGRIGAVAQIPFDLKAAIGRNMTAVRCREGIITPTYLIEYLRSPYFEREKNLKQDLGTVMGSLNVKGIIRLNITIPSHNVVKEFEMAVRPFRYRIEIFQKQNDILQRTRDLLLPKLISGVIDVSELDIRIPEAEA